MAMLASKSPYGTNLTSAQQMPPRQFSESSQQRSQSGASALQDGMFISPTDSEFSESYDGLDSVRAWDERKVCDWLRSIRCGQYETLFKQNNFTGESLLECDQKVLAEMGIKKIGDRVRINVAIKQLRNKSSTRSRLNRDSLALLENLGPAPSNTSPRLHASRAQAIQPRSGYSALKTNSRPNSPLAAVHDIRGNRYVSSPLESAKRDASNGYFSQPGSAATTTGRRPEPAMIQIQPLKSANHLRQNSSIDGLTAGGLPINSPIIKIIHGGGHTKVVNVGLCKSADDVTATVLRKVQLPEKHFRNYCFYVLEGIDPTPANCRRISDDELIAICKDVNRSERNKLILRKINDGAPDLDEVGRAARVAFDESQALHSAAIGNSNPRSQIKIEQLTGKSWSDLQMPLSPAPTMDRHHNFIPTANEYDRQEAELAQPNSKGSITRVRPYFGARPPSEMIVQELTSYFPDHKSEDIEKTMRMSVRRSQRMSRAASRLSVVSNFSTASSLRDAPPVPAIPNIADSWLSGPGAHVRSTAPRPLSVSKFGFPASSFRDSIISTALQPLREESPTEIRKSYISFADSEPEPDSALEKDHDLFDDSLSPSGSDTLNSRLSMIVAEDGEEEDAALTSFLAGNSFDKNNWMKGDLIGEGSFGSVYLALHAVTGELMAVKQVELPSITAGTEGDKKRANMVNALKLEIELLQGLHHEHIVQYLGTSSDETHLNIFLEYVPGGSIAGMLKQYNTFGEPLIRNFTRQILDGLSYLHKHNIIHRDIKGANILVDNRGAVKISDFGVSKKQGFNNSNAPGARTSLQGSVFWMAPEVVRQTGQSIKSDIWSLGCLIVEMFTGCRPFPLMTTLQTLFAVGSNGEKPSIPDSASEAARNFLNLTFEVDPEKRPGAEELLKEPFMLPIAQP